MGMMLQLECDVVGEFKTAPRYRDILELGPMSQGGWALVENDRWTDVMTANQY